MSQEYIQGLELGFNLGLRFKQMEQKYSKLLLECKPLRNKQLLIKVEVLSSQHTDYLRYLEDVIREKDVTIQQQLQAVVDFLKTSRKEYSDLYVQVRDLREARAQKRKQKAKSTTVLPTPLKQQHV
jgi:hypothetical protein